MKQALFSFLNGIKVNYKVFLLIVVLKFVFVILGHGFSFSKTYSVSSFGGDPFDYLRFASQLASTGEYRLPGTIDGVTEYVYRMPGMAFVLAPLMFFFSVSIAVKLFIVFQILVSSYAATLLYSFLSEKIRFKAVNYLLLFFIAFGVYFNRYTSFILSETIAQSLFIIIAIYFLKEKRNVVNITFIVIGLAFAWMFFLRPFMIVFFPLICLRIADFSSLKLGISRFLKSNKPVFVFSFIVIGITSVWTLRNYLKTKELVVMEYSVKPEKTKFMKECISPMYDYIRHFGGNQYVTRFDMKNSHLLWFYPDSSIVKNEFKRPSDKIFPKVVFSDGITIDSLINIRNLIDSTLSSEIGSVKREKYFSLYKGAISRADKAVLNNTNLLFHLKNRKDAFLRFMIQPLSNTKVFKRIKVVQAFMIYFNKIINLFFITLIIVFSFVFGLVKLKQFYFLFIPALFLLYFFIGYYNIKEERELYCFYPVFLIIGMEALSSIITKYFKKNN